MAGKAPVEEGMAGDFPAGQSKAPGDQSKVGCSLLSPVHASALQAFLEFQPILPSYFLPVI
jgi:hypothetical protein